MAANPETIFETVAFTLNGKNIEALAGESIIQAADRTGTEIPRLCYTEGMRADGNCRACVVEIDGERALARVAVATRHPAWSSILIMPAFENHKSWC